MGEEGEGRGRADGAARRAWSRAGAGGALRCAWAFGEGRGCGARLGLARSLAWMEESARAGRRQRKGSSTGGVQPAQLTQA